jgi:hypothetical protein
MRGVGSTEVQQFDPSESIPDDSHAYPDVSAFEVLSFDLPLKLFRVLESIIMHFLLLERLPSCLRMTSGISHLPSLDAHLGVLLVLAFVLPTANNPST